MNAPVLSPDFHPEIQVVHDRIMTTSLDIANNFGKRHDNILRDIKALEVPEDFNRLNFEVVEYTDSKGERRPMYLITRDGFTILAMGFTGKRAMEFKIRYIEAFNRMEEELRRQREHPRPLEDPETLLRRKREQDRIRQARHRAKLAEIRKSIPQDRFPEDCGYLELNFPEQTAKPSRPFWKDLPDNPGSLSIQDLLDPDYPDPIRQVLECLEKAGYDVQGPWTQYQAMKEHLRSCAEVFTEIYELVRGRRRDRWPL